MKCRAENWENGEKIFLLSLVQEHKDITNSRQNDVKTLLAKNTAWEKIHKSFSAKYGNRRTLKELVGQWKRVRIAAKKEASHFYKESASRGGGGPCPSPLSNATQLVQQMCPQDFMSMLNPYDDDSGTKSEDKVSAETFLDHSQGFDNVEIPEVELDPRSN